MAEAFEEVFNRWIECCGKRMQVANPENKILTNTVVSIAMSDALHEIATLKRKIEQKDQDINSIILNKDKEIEMLNDRIVDLKKDVQYHRDLVEVVSLRTVRDSKENTPQENLENK